MGFWDSFKNLKLTTTNSLSEDYHKIGFNLGLSVRMKSVECFVIRQREFEVIGVDMTWFNKSQHKRELDLLCRLVEKGDRSEKTKQWCEDFAKGFLPGYGKPANFVFDPYNDLKRNRYNKDGIEITIHYVRDK